MSSPSGPRGAGRSGGLLFLLIVGFVLYLVITAVAGIVKFLLGAALLVGVLALAANVIRRR